jgi:hypothetical protein
MLAMIAPVLEGGRTPDAFDAFAMTMRMEPGLLGN